MTIPVTVTATSAATVNSTFEKYLEAEIAAWGVASEGQKREFRVGLLTMKGNPTDGIRTRNFIATLTDPDPTPGPYPIPLA